MVSQAYQSGKYIAKAFTPFWIRGQQREMEREAGLGRQMLPLIGVMPAPAALSATPAEELAKSLRGKLDRPKTEKEAEKSKAEAKIVQRLRKSPGADISKDAAAIGLNPREVSLLRQRAKITPLQYAVRGMPLEPAERVYAKANPKEKELLKGIMESKRRGGTRGGSPEKLNE